MMVYRSVIISTGDTRSHDGVYASNVAFISPSLSLMDIIPLLYCPGFPFYKKTPMCRIVLVKG